MEVDAHFAKGRSHVVCEDYADSDMTYGKGILVSSDGCSESDNTDVGARIITRLAAQKLAFEPLEQLHTVDGFLASIMLQADGIRKLLGLRQQCLDATLLLAQVDAVWTKVMVVGDGYVIMRAREEEGGRLRIIKIESSGNAPEYPSYLLDVGRRERLRLEYGAEKTISETFYKDGVLVDKSEPRTVQTIAWCDEIKTHVLEFVAIASDGLGTFSMGEMSDVEAIHELTRYKSVKGAFVKRRMKRFLAECEKKDIHHADDIAMAVAHLEAE